MTLHRGAAALVVLAAVIAGCAEPKKPEATVPPKTEASGEHGHKPSAHGGTLIPIGSDSYHAEAVFEQGGTLRLYLLGKDESKVLEIEAQPLSGFVKGDGAAEAESIVLTPKPQPGDEAGKTSLFVGHLPRALVGQKVEVTIPAIRINGERFRVGFASTAHEQPTKVADAEEKKLYLTPGGAYTQADIAANGSRVASEKFKGVRAEHDLKAKPGEPICPVTLTKANAKFSWIVGGKTYQFCCPPCVDEFVAGAKENATLPDPETFRKK